MTGNGARPLLELSTLEPERPTVVIDGVAYSLALPEDFGLADQARLLRLQRRVERLVNVDEFTDEEAEDAGRALREIAHMLLPDCPPQVLGRLKDQHIVRLLQVFTQAAGATPPQQEGERRRQRTGVRSSPASSATTGEPR